MGYTYGENENWGSSTSNYLVLGQIDHDIAYHSDFSTVLYVGHGTADGFYGYSSGGTPDLIYFDDIQSHTESSAAHQFVFMWVCSGGNNSPDGSPTAWNPLWWSYPPSYPPYTWIGFDDASPWLIDSMNANNIYQYWLVFFYYFALHPQDNAST